MFFNSTLVVSLLLTSTAALAQSPPSAVIAAQADPAFAMDYPIVPAATISPLADEDTAKAAKRTSTEQLEGDMKKANADLAGLDSKLFPLSVQRRDLWRAASDPKADDASRAVAKESLKKLEEDLKPLEKQYQETKEAAANLCQRQFQPSQTNYYLTSDDQKADYNKNGFSCATGERMVADTGKTQLFACGMQVKKIRGAYGFGAGFNAGGAPQATPCTTSGMGSGGMMAPTGKVACLNEKGTVVASALIFDSKFGRFLAANTRYNFDTDGRVNGWKAHLGPAVTEVSIKGDRVIKTTSIKDTQTSKCEWPANGDAIESFLSGQPAQKAISPTNLTQ